MTDRNDIERGRRLARQDRRTNRAPDGESWQEKRERARQTLEDQDNTENT